MSQKSNEKRQNMKAEAGKEEIKNGANVPAEVSDQKNGLPEVKPETESKPEPEKIENVVSPDADGKAKPRTREEFDAALTAKMRMYPRKISIGELIAYRKDGVETWLECQRIPSHTKTTAEAIIDSALQNIPLGVITLGHNTDNDTISTINGSSRIDDFIAYHDGLIGRKDMKYVEISPDMRTRFLKTQISVDWLQGTTAELIRDFINLNSNTALTGGQKAVGKLVNTTAMDVIAALKKHSVFRNIFSARQIQKEEPQNCILLDLANIKGCYFSSISKITEALAGKDCSDIDIDKLVYIFDRIEAADVELTKFKFVHLVHLLYLGDCWKAKNLHKYFKAEDVTDTDIAVAVSVNYQTAGTNSADQNEKRIEIMAKKLYGQLSTATAKKPQADMAPVLNPDDLDAVTA